MKKLIIWLLITFYSLMIIPVSLAVKEDEAEEISSSVMDNKITAPSAILIEHKTGTVLFEKDADKKLPPASITKIMTMLLTVEAIDNGTISLDDIVVCSENVPKMEGSKVFLDKGEKMSVHELLKSIAVASGNDASIAMAEYIAGSEEGFVELMNKRAQELGMTNTTFKNCTGLDDEGHLTTARDISIMASELLNHPIIFEYTTIWIDYVRDGQFMLSNTNKLIRFYDGATGLKTGSTSIAKYCLCGTAKRENMHLIAVILGAENTKLRFSETQNLLNYGFANYTLVENLGGDKLTAPIPVLKGKKEFVNVHTSGNNCMVVEKANKNKVECEVIINPNIEAPIEKDQKLGEGIFKIDGSEIGKVDILANEDVLCLTVFDVFTKLLHGSFMLS